MVRLKGVTLYLSWIALALLAVSGCQISPPSTVLPGETASTFVQAPQPLATIPVIPLAKLLLPTATAGPSSVELGQPFWIGRGQIVDAVFLPGAKQIAIAWGSGVSVAAVDNGQELWYQPVSANLFAFDLQPGGKVIAAAAADGSLALFDAASGSVRRVEGAWPKTNRGDIAWSPDGRALAVQVIAPDNQVSVVYVLDAASGRAHEVPSSAGNGTGEGLALFWSPDSAAIVLAAHEGGCPRLVDVQTGAERMHLGWPPGDCFPLAPLLWMPNGRMLAVRGRTGGVEVLRYPENTLTRTFHSASSTSVYPGMKRSLFYSPNGSWLAFRGGADLYGYDDQQPLTVWDLGNGKLFAQTTGLPALAQSRRMAAAFAGASILVFYQSGEITRWNFLDPGSRETIVMRVPALPAAAFSLRWSAAGSRAAFSGRSGGVEVWDLDAKQLIRRFDPPLDTPALSPDGRQAALFDPATNSEGVYDLNSGRLLRGFPASRVLMGPAFSPDGRLLAYGSGAKVLVSDLATGQSVSLEPASGMTVTRLVWSPDSQALVTVTGGAEAGVIFLWKRAGDGSFTELYHVANVNAGLADPNLVLAAFNPSGSRVALQGRPGLEAGQMRMVVYDLKAGQILQSLSEISPGAWSSDDVLLTSLGRIDVTNGALEYALGAGSAFAPDGTFYLQRIDLGVAILHWARGRSAPIGPPETLNLLDYGWSPNGHWVAFLGDDGTIRVRSVRASP